MKPVRYDEDADEELIDEIARYELRREGLGIEFLTAVREAVRLINQNQVRGKHPSTRVMSAGS
jgi:hypothetical protein